MKLYIAILLVSSLYVATALSNNPWVLVSQGLAGNSPFTKGLDDIGGRNNLGQAYDSGIFNKTDGGEVTNNYNSWFQSAANNSFNYSSELQLSFLDDTNHNSKYAISIDPETGRRDIIWWSLQLLTGDGKNGPAGKNITYDADTDTVTVTSFEGIDQWILYQLGQPLNETDLDNTTDITVDNSTNVAVDNTTNPTVDNTTNLTVEVYDSLRDYHHNFIGYTEVDRDTYTSDEGLQNAINNGVAQAGDDAGLNNVNITQINTVDTIVDINENLWVRVDADIDSDTNSGRIVTVVLCEGGSDCSDSALQYWWWKSVLLA